MCHTSEDVGEGMLERLDLFVNDAHQHSCKRADGGTPRAFGAQEGQYADEEDAATHLDDFKIVDARPIYAEEETVGPQVRIPISEVSCSYRGHVL